MLSIIRRTGGHEILGDDESTFVVMNVDLCNVRSNDFVTWRPRMSYLRQPRINKDSGDRSESTVGRFFVSLHALTATDRASGCH